MINVILKTTLEHKDLVRSLRNNSNTVYLHIDRDFALRIGNKDNPLCTIEYYSINFKQRNELLTEILIYIGKHDSMIEVKYDKIKRKGYLIKTELIELK